VIKEQEKISIEKDDISPVEPVSVAADNIGTVNVGDTTNNNNNTKIKIKNVIKNCRPGWPFNFDEPKDAVPFPGITMDMGMIMYMYDYLGTDEHKCIAKDKKTIEKFQSFLLELVHNVGRHQNIFNNPKRCDQAIALGADFWKSIHIDYAISQLQENLTEQLEHHKKLLPDGVNPEVITSLTDSFKTAFDKKKYSEFNSHLRNIEQRVCAEQQSNSAMKTITSFDVKSFEDRTDRHIKVNELCNNFCYYRDSMLKVELDIERKNTPGRSQIAHNGIKTLANFMLMDHPENLNVIPVMDGEDVVVFMKYDEWEIFSKEEAIKRIAKSHLEILDEYMRCKLGQHLIPLADHISSIFDSHIKYETSSTDILVVYADYAYKYSTKIKQNPLAFPEYFGGDREIAGSDFIMKLFKPFT
jgi:hypothetical protein